MSVAVVSGLTVTLVLIVSGSNHVLNLVHLEQEMALQGVLPPPHRRWGVALVGIELTAAGLCAATLLGAGIPPIVAFSGLALLMMAFGAYSWLLLRRGSAAPCACDTSRTPVSIWTVLRALLYALLSMLAILVPAEISTSTILEALVVAPVLAALTWVLPRWLANISIVEQPIDAVGAD